MLEHDIRQFQRMAGPKGRLPALEANSSVMTRHFLPPASALAGQPSCRLCQVSLRKCQSVVHSRQYTGGTAAHFHTTLLSSAPLFASKKILHHPFRTFKSQSVTVPNETQIVQRHGISAHPRKSRPLEPKPKPTPENPRITLECAMANFLQTNGTVHQVDNV